MKTNSSSLLAVAIRPSNREELQALWAQAAHISEHVELCVDQLQELYWDILDTLKPTIITVVRLDPLIVLQLVRRMRPKYLDISGEHTPALFAEVKRVCPQIQVIASYHNYQETPVHIENIYQQLKKLPCDVIKIATFARSSLDGLRLLDFMKTYGKQFPLIGVCMGEKGAFTRVLAPLYNSPISYACITEEYQTASGQMSYDMMTSTYHFHRLSPKTQPFALLGNPVSHSVSHHVHNKIFSELHVQHGIDSVYVKIQVDQAEFQQVLTYLQRLGFNGISITTPLKYSQSSKTPYNTALFRDEISFCNTDGAAVIDAISQHIDVRGKKIAVIGSGPTAINIARCGEERGAVVSIFNRSIRSIEYPLYSLEELPHMLKEFPVCIQATSCGMNEGDALPIHASWFAPKVVALDVIAKSDTHFLQQIQMAGGVAISGLEMWARQAAKQYAFWFETIQEEAILTRLLQLKSIIRLRKSCIDGAVYPPSSKSHSIRAILLATFTDGVSRIKNVLQSPDIDAAIEVCRRFGADIVQEGSWIHIRGVGDKRVFEQNTFDAKNSGIVARFGVALSSLFSEAAYWIGDQSMMQQRPIRAALDALSQLNVITKSHHGFFPCIVQGPIKCGECVIDGRDSQPVSALLFAASLTAGKTVIYVDNPGEKPWIDVTFSWLDRMNVSYVRNGYHRFAIEGKSYFQPFEVTIPVDWSSAMYPIALALMTPSDVVIHGIDFSDIQGDKKALDLLEAMGAYFEKNELQQTLSVRGPQQLCNIDIDINDIIDLLSLFAVIGTYASGTMRLYNGAVARSKECDRIASIACELQKMNADIEEKEDGLVIRNSSLRGASVVCYEDHRMALALACAASIATGETEIVGVDCMKKTYPHFIACLQGSNKSSK